MNYLLVDDKGAEIEAGESVGRLEKENFTVLPKSGHALAVPYRDVLDIEETDYRINLVLSSKEKLVLFNLGYSYDDFLRMFMKLRNELLLKDLLMHEKLRKKEDVEAEFSYFDEDGKEKNSGDCKVRLYETGLVVIPLRSEIFRIPYSDIEIKEEDYSLVLTTDFGEKLTLSKMGWQHDPFKQMLTTINNELQSKVLALLQELFPNENPLQLRKIAQFMKEGKAASQSDIESVNLDLWLQLEKRLESAEIKEQYDFLKSLSQQKKACIGLKRGLLGDLTGEYVWFFIPIYSVNPKEPGNAIAMEAASEESGGKATYFFRIVSRGDYPNFKNIKDLHVAVDDFIKRMSRCMLDINFRREPIYLPDERLEEPRHIQYRFAVQKLSSLRVLRSHFIGRVIHTSPEQWKNDVIDLLKFNVTAQDDSVKWKRGK
jgi:hypothetical protein